MLVPGGSGLYSFVLFFRRWAFFYAHVLIGYRLFLCPWERECQGEGVRQGISFESFRNTHFGTKREGCRKLSCEIVPGRAVLAVTFGALYLCKGKVVTTRRYRDRRRTALEKNRTLSTFSGHIFSWKLSSLQRYFKPMPMTNIPKYFLNLTYQRYILLKNYYAKTFFLMDLRYARKISIFAQILRI